MTIRSIDFDVLNDDKRWADPYDCAELQMAGIWFLYETLCSRHANCQLLDRIKSHGDNFELLYRKSEGRVSNITNGEMATMLTEMNLLGTLGHSLWHLRNYLDSAGLKYEIEQLSKVVSGETYSSDSLNLRGQGFLLIAAANIVKHGFELEFIPRRSKEGQDTPDFFALRDDIRFTCDATTRYPRRGDFEDMDFFWTVVNETVDKKTHQFRSPEFQNGVLIIDCTPVWDAFDLSQIRLGGTLMYYVPLERGGPKSGSVPFVRYDDYPSAQRLRNLEKIIDGTGIDTVILWKNQFVIDDDLFRRDMSYRVIGTLKGANFWSYFGKAIAFPGPGVDVKWSEWPRR